MRLMYEMRCYRAIARKLLGTTHLYFGAFRTACSYTCSAHFVPIAEGEWQTAV